MTTISIREAKNRLTELARQVEAGATIVVTRSGRPVFDLVPHRPRMGLRLEALTKLKRGLTRTGTTFHIAEDFDAPLPEDVLLRPLPNGE
jgi:prevent-host-death family protein